MIQKWYSTTNAEYRAHTHTHTRALTRKQNIFFHINTLYIYYCQQTYSCSIVFVTLLIPLFRLLAVFIQSRAAHSRVRVTKWQSLCLSLRQQQLSYDQTVYGISYLVSSRNHNGCLCVCLNVRSKVMLEVGVVLVFIMKRKLGYSEVWLLKFTVFYCVSFANEMLTLVYINMLVKGFFKCSL